jgi:hypothetical protein
LRAADHTRARIESYQLLVEPEPYRAERRLCGDTIRAADVAEGALSRHSPKSAVSYRRRGMH